MVNFVVIWFMCSFGALTPMETETDSSKTGTIPNWDQCCCCPTENTMKTFCMRILYPLKLVLVSVSVNIPLDDTVKFYSKLNINKQK